MQIEFKHVDFAYGAGTPFEVFALKDVNITIPDNSYTAIIGHTGSGKSTVTQHLNALLAPTKGIVQIGDREITPDSSRKKLREIRQKVGIVFQFPEAQLFEETVVADVMFGPKNFGASEDEARGKAERALEQVGIAPELFDRSPFDLSGGQMRRVAIAGVLAMSPRVLVLDEPTAGLDPKSREAMMDMFYKLHIEEGMTIVLVTHQMDDVAEFADYVVVMENGTCIRQGTPLEIFEDETWLKERRLGLPETIKFARDYEAFDKQADLDAPLTIAELAEALAAEYQKRNREER